MPHSHNTQQNPPSTDMQPVAERFSELWTDYLEGQLEPIGMAELEALLAADDRLAQRAADLYQTHRLLGLLADERLADRSGTTPDRFVADVMAQLPDTAERLTAQVMAEILAAPAVGRQTVRESPLPRWLPSFYPVGLLVVGIAAIVTAAGLWPRQPAPPPPSGRQSPADIKQADGTSSSAVRFANLARAHFLNHETPPQQSVADQNETYVLSHGLVELAFPGGATAILEGPSAFRVCGEACLAVDAGRCSVHAPDGAEGFRVETPNSQVIDRGTRFVVAVDETSVTEVEVIEGAADLLVAGDPTGRIYRLASGEKARHDPADGEPVVATTGGDNQTGYRPQLPDRLIRYTATLAHPAPPAAGSSDAPGIDTLETITIQRNGSPRTYHVDSLIGVNLLHLRANRNRNNLTLPAGADFTAKTLQSATTRRGLLEADRLLTTGVINPGGGPDPLAADPAMTTDATELGDLTPGLGFRFNRPVRNGAGPDVVVFELQMLTDPPESDAFRVSPLRFTPGLRTHTVTSYDIDSTSPESHLLARFQLFTFSRLPGSLDDLLTLPTNSGNLLPVRARANAVAIDLADLGYPAEASCDGLFLQDADDDKTTVDPVFIAGLPPLEEKVTP